MQLGRKPLKLSPTADFTEFTNALNSLSKSQAASLRAQYRGLDTGISSYQKLAQQRISPIAAAGPGISQREQEAQQRSNRVLQQLDLNLSRQAVTQKQKELQVSQQLMQQNIRLVAMLTNLTMGGSNPSVRGAFSRLAMASLATGGGAVGGGTAASGLSGGLSPSVLTAAITGLVGSGGLSAITAVASALVLPAAITGVAVALNSFTSAQSTSLQNLGSNVRNCRKS